MRSRGDLTGNQYSFWCVLGPAEKSKSGKKRWLCKCICGRERSVFQNVLLNGKSRSCGCRNGEDLTDQQFGFLTALRPVIRGDGVKVWLCKCICGEEPLVRPNSLKRGATTSCGCEGLKRRKEALRKSSTLKPCRYCGRISKYCIICNRAKQDMPTKEFQDWIDSLVAYQLKEP
jgi:hypothetical protein